MTRLRSIRFFRRRLVVALAVAGCAAVVPAAYSAPPANDGFAAATAIAGASGSVEGVNTEATKEPGEPAHGDDPGGHSVWYSWTSPLTGAVLMETCGSSFDTLLGAYRGNAVTALTRLASNDDSCDEGSRVIFQAVAGEEYRIAVDGFQGASGGFTLRWQASVPPPNDAFATAEQLSGASGRTTGTTIGATREAGEPAHHEEAAANSIWFSWTAPSSATAIFSTCGSSFDTILAAYTGDAVDRLTVRAVNDDTSACGDGTDNRSLVSFAAAAGTTYRLAVVGFDEAAGDVTLSWSLRTPPRNDAFTRARAIAGMRGRVAASTLGATRQTGESLHGGPGGASVWFRWRAPRTMRVEFSTCGARFDTLLAVYRGTRLGSLRALARDDDGCNPGSRAAANVVRGTVYRIAVDGFGGASGNFALAWRAAPCVVPRVVGLPFARAAAAIRGAGCSVGRVRRIASSLVPRGRVIAQSPAAGRRLAARARVHLEVSR